MTTNPLPPLFWLDVNVTMEKKFADYVLAQDRVKFLVVFVMYKKKEFEVCFNASANSVVS